MFNAIFLYRISRYLFLKKVPIIPKVLYRINFLLYNCSIPYKTTIGKNSFLSHSGIGVVINQRSTIGSFVEIGTNVTIGSKFKHGAAPIIGNKVYIATGAKIIGGITIGNNVIIGANSVVTNDIPDNSIAVGMPAKVIKNITNDEINNYF